MGIIDKKGASHSTQIQPQPSRLQHQSLPGPQSGRCRYCWQRERPRPGWPEVWVSQIASPGPLQIPSHSTAQIFSPATTPCFVQPGSSHPQCLCWFCAWTGGQELEKTWMQGMSLDLISLLNTFFSLVSGLRLTSAQLL